MAISLGIYPIFRQTQMSWFRDLTANSYRVTGVESGLKHVADFDPSIDGMFAHAGMVSLLIFEEGRSHQLHLAKESALGGWCTGGTQCTYQPVPTGCMATRQNENCRGKTMEKKRSCFCPSDQAIHIIISYNVRPPRYRSVGANNSNFTMVYGTQITIVPGANLNQLTSLGEATLYGFHLDLTVNSGFRIAGDPWVPMATGHGTLDGAHVR
jgi:hypothetical protein